MQHVKERERERDEEETEMDVCSPLPGKYEENNREQNNKREKYEMGTFFQRVLLYRTSVCMFVCSGL